MARVVFSVERELGFPAERVFDELIDWPGHARWVPLTRVSIESGDGGVGTQFVASSGLGPLSLPDRMRVDALDRVERTVLVTKIGPVLTGVVRLAVVPTGESSCRLDWVEDIRVPGLPQSLSRPVAAVAAKGFSASIARLARQLAAR